MMKERIIKKIGIKKFLYVLPTLGIGGAELQTINQLNYFQENEINNFSLVILSDKVDKKCASSLMLPREKMFVIGINNMEVISSKSLFASFKAVKNLSKIIIQTKSNSVLAVLLISQWVTRLTKVYHFITFKPTFEIISYYRGLDYQLFLKKKFYLRIFNTVNKAMAFFTDNKSVFISRAVKNDVVKHFYVNNSSIIIHNSLPEVKVDSVAGQEFLHEYGIQKNIFVLVVPGVVNAAIKGHFFFVEAFKLFLSRKSISPKEFKVIIAGDGPDFEKLKVLISKYELSDYFIFNGFMQNNDLLSLFNVIDLVVVPSISEGFGNVIIEALRQQALILASDTGGIPEIIKDGKNGLLFKSNNIDSLVERLNYVYENKGVEIIDKEKMKNTFESKFTLESQIANIVEFVS